MAALYLAMAAYWWVYAGTMHHNVDVATLQACYAGDASAATCQALYQHFGW